MSPRRATRPSSWPSLALGTALALGAARAGAQAPEGAGGGDDGGQTAPDEVADPRAPGDEHGEEATVSPAWLDPAAGLHTPEAPATGPRSEAPNIDPESEEPPPPRRRQVEEPPPEPQRREWLLRVDGGAILPPAGFGALTIGFAPSSWLAFELSIGGSAWGLQDAIFLRGRPIATVLDGVELALSLDFGLSSANGPAGWFAQVQPEVGLELQDESGFTLLAAFGEPIALTGISVGERVRCIPPCLAGTNCTVPFPPTCGFGMPYGRLGMGYMW